MTGQSKAMNKFQSKTMGKNFVTEEGPTVNGHSTVHSYGPIVTDVSDDHSLFQKQNS